MGDTEHPPGKRPTFTQRIEAPWMMYAGLLTALSVAERLATPEAIGVDQLIDTTINVVGLLGLVGGAIWSVRAARAYSRAARPVGRVTRLLLGGFFGPLLAVVAVAAIADDVDGGIWLIASPVLGALLVYLVLAVVTIVAAWRRRATRQSAE